MNASFTTATIVLLGEFEPDVFRLDELERARVISPREAKLAKYRLLAPREVLHFELSWGNVLVAKDRVQVGTDEAPFVRTCDFVMKAFRDLSTKAEVRAFGINVESHFDLKTIKARDAVGIKVAPPDAWGEWGKGVLASINSSNNLLHGGVMHLQMRQPFVEEKVSGWLDVSIGPSTRVSDSTGLFLRTNHHHQLSRKKVSDEDEGGESAQSPSDKLALLEFLAGRFDSSIQSAESIFSGVLGK